MLPLDCKMSVDDNALYRRKALAELRDDSQIDAKEAAANAANVNYVALTGNIGCLVNGAGLAMATMDLIKLHGGEPANFLDVGGGATAETVAEASRSSSPTPTSRRCWSTSSAASALRHHRRGHLAAVKEVGLKVPVIVRLEGTNVELGRKIWPRAASA